MPPVTADPGAAARNLECRIADRIPALPILLIIGIGLLVPMPAGWLKHPLAVALTGLVHVLIFALVTLFVYRRGPLSGHLTYSFFAVLLLGMAIEVIQPLVGRSASLDDVIFDAVGGLLAVAWIWRCRSGRRRPVILVVVVLATIVVMLRQLPAQLMAMGAVTRNFPVLADFTDERALALWRPTYGARIERRHPEDPAPGLASAGNSAHLLVTGGPSRLWPGAVFHYFPRDWSDYSVLAFRARAVGTATAAAVPVAVVPVAAAPVAEAIAEAVAEADTSCLLTPFCVRLDDIAGERSNVWFTQCFAASDGWQDFQIDLRSLQSNVGDRGLNLQKLLSVVIFFPQPSESTSLALDDLRLR